jgi:hypothetical protein
MFDLKKITFSICIFFLALQQNVNANQFSYVYIQGDKKTPIYVKLDGVMLPRYNKNFAILSELAPGEAEIEILFQQNVYPSQKFSIKIPEAGKRAFILTQKNDNFSLYDIEQNFYLNANNDIEDDHLPKVINNTIIQENRLVDKSHISEEPKTESNITKVNTIEKPIDLATEVESKTKHSPSNQPQFIDNITFDNSDVESIKKEENSIFKNSSSEPQITNSDCKSAINDFNLNKILRTLGAKKTENEKIGFVQDIVKNNCFTCEQAELITNNFTSQNGLLIVLKTLYPKITNQENYFKFQSLFTDEDFKDAFERLTNKNY